MSNYPHKGGLSLKLTKENNIRTRLLLISLSELNEYKKNKTKINTTLSIDLISKYESIEIVIENPVEMGNPKRYQSTKNTNMNRKCASHKGTPVTTPWREEINQFVQNLNKTLCSERKLENNDSQGNTLKYNPKRQCKKRNESAKDIYATTFKKMKKGCKYLRKLSSTIISRNLFWRNLKKLQYEPNALKDNMELNQATSNEANIFQRSNTSVQFAFSEMMRSKGISDGNSKINSITPYHSTKLLKSNIIRTRKASSNNIQDDQQIFDNNTTVGLINNKESLDLNKKQTLLRIAENYHEKVTECNLF